MTRFLRDVTGSLAVAIAMINLLCFASSALAGESSTKRFKFSFEVPMTSTLDTSNPGALAWNMNPNVSFTNDLRTLASEFLTPCFGSYGGSVYNFTSNQGSATFWQRNAPPCGAGSARVYRGTGNTTERTSGIPPMTASVKMRVIGNGDISLGITRYRPRDLTINDTVDMIIVDNVELSTMEDGWLLYDARFSNWRKYDRHEVSLSSIGLRLDGGYRLKHQSYGFRPSVGVEALRHSQSVENFGAWVPFESIFGPDRLDDRTPEFEPGPAHHQSIWNARVYIGAEASKRVGALAVGIQGRYYFGDYANTMQMPETWRGSYPVSAPMTKLTYALTISR